MPNDLGLFDMLGNADEWSHDRYQAVRPSENGLFRDVVTAEEALADKQQRMFRGGSFTSPASELRSAHRAMNAPIDQLYVAGFRVARTLP